MNVNNLNYFIFKVAFKPFNINIDEIGQNIQKHVLCR
jgi:hypothetical protein